VEPALSAQHRDCVRGNCCGPNSILNTRSDPKGVDSVVDRETQQRGDEKCKNCVASSFVTDSRR
jgi:hydroxyethylthiazole kinase-like sugar kinase family protein